MNPIPELKKHFGITIDKLKEDLKTIRTGHASPALLEGLQVETYGTTMRLMEVATITTEGPTLLVVAPFDPGTLQDIERGITKSPLGLTSSNQGGRLFIKIPPLSEEQREKYVKLASGMIEEYKNTIRGYRDDVRKKIKHAFEAKDISEDEKFRLEKTVEDETKKINEHVETIREHKEQEITTV